MNADAGFVMGYLGSFTKVCMEASPCRMQVLPTHHSDSPEESRTFLERLRGTAGGIGRVVPADYRPFEEEGIYGPDGEVWAGPGGLAWVIDSPADLRRLAAFMRQGSARAPLLLAGRYLGRAEQVEALAATAATHDQGGASASSDGAPCCDCCGKQGIPLKRCAACKSKRNCSRECQRRSWLEQGHKEQCAELAAAMRLS